MSTLILQHPQRLKSGAYFSNISNDDKSQIVITTPSLKIVSDGVIQGTRYNYVEVEVDTGIPKQKSFVDSIESIELTTKERIIEKRSAWFYEDIDADDIHYFFQSALRNIKGETGKYTIRIIVGRRNMGRTTWESTIYDENDVIKSTGDFKKGCRIAVAVLCKGLHFTSSSFAIEFIGNEILMLNDEPVTAVSRDLLKQYTEEDEKATDLVDTSMNKTTGLDDTIATHTAVLDNSGVEQVDEPKDDVSNENTTNDTLRDTVSDTLDVSGNQGETIDTSASTVTLIVDTEEQKQSPVKDDLLSQSSPAVESECEKTEELKNHEDDEETNEELREVDIQPDENDSIDIRKPAEVFFEIYKEALNKARRAKEKALMAYLEALNIKNTYLVGETIPSDELDSVISSLDGSDVEDNDGDDSDGEEVRVSGVLKEIDNLSDMDENEIRNAIVSSQ